MWCGVVWEENKTEPKRGDADCQSLKEVGNMVSGTEESVSQKGPITEQSLGRESRNVDCSNNETKGLSHKPQVY